ncbi:MAG: NAD(P) transhydrogenase subunit alpha [Thermoleophilaceae bacterium]|nr:NAD(P) transhydrogenase subunit alpha [Thermoleophilaceae bacterium]
MDYANLLQQLTILVLSAFVGFEVISKVPATLHTPLMSATNAIHGIVVVGALLVAGAAAQGTVQIILGTLAVFFGALNVTGGFVVTDRMLEMFKKKPAKKEEASK